jgi:hypothetical protein
MKFNLTIFTGNKFCLFNYATIATGGFVDFDWFRINAVAQTGVESGNLSPSGDSPNTYLLGRNYPNPFNPTTMIRYRLPVTSQMSLKVNNLLGREVVTLYDDVLQPGTCESTFDGSRLASGVYFDRLHTNQFIANEKMLMIR